MMTEIDFVPLVVPGIFDITPQLGQWILVDAETLPLGFTDLASPAAVSLKIPRTRLRVSSFTFADPAPAPKQPHQPPPAALSPSPPLPLSPFSSKTRLQPPRDVI